MAEIYYLCRLLGPAIENLEALRVPIAALLSFDGQPRKELSKSNADII